jgi:hypothetical protein
MGCKQAGGQRSSNSSSMGVLLAGDVYSEWGITQVQGNAMEETGCYQVIIT